MDFPGPDRVLRRDLLRVGSLGAVGLAVPDLLNSRLHGADSTGSASADPRARSCILFFLEGGPAHQDLWDMKPLAPAEVRGEFQPIASTLPGVSVCEHLPLLARQMHRLALVRSVHHEVV